MRSLAWGFSQRARQACAAAVMGAVLQAILSQGVEAALSRDEVEEMEALLAHLNFDPGPVDGVIDERTRAAIVLYQQFAALPEDGEANEALLAELRGVAGAFKDLKAQRATQAGADAGVGGMRSETSPEPDPPPESAPAADDALAANGAADPMPEPMPDGMPAEDVSAPSEDPPVIGERTTAASPAAEKPPATEQSATEMPVQQDGAAEEPGDDASEVGPDEEQAAKEEAKPAGFSIRSVLARLLGSAQEDEGEAEAEGGAEAEAAPAPAAADEAAAQDPPPVETPLDLATEVDAAAAPEPASAGETQTASLARGGYAAFGAAHAAAVEGSLDRAIAAYTVALRSGDLAPVHAALAHYNRADALYRLRRYDEAIADYDAAIEKDPSFADAYYNRGYAHQASGDRRRAIGDFREARALGLQRVGNRAPSAPPPLP